MLRLLDRVALAAASATFRYPLRSLLVVLALLAAIFSFLPQLRLDGRIEAFMHRADPALLAYYEMRRKFGQDNRIVVTVGAPDIFEKGFLEKLARLHRELAAKVPYVAEMFSPYNIPFIEHAQGGIYVEELVRNILARDQDPRAMRGRIQETPLYRNFIISADGKTAAIVIEPNRYAPHSSDCIARPELGQSCAAAPAPVERGLLGAPHYAEMTAAVHAVVAGYAAPGAFEVQVAGAPVVSTEIVRLMSADMPRFMLLCLGITIVVILVMYRSPTIAVAALATFVATILTTLGLMAAAGEPVTPPTQLLIPLVLVATLCTFVHLISALRQGYRETADKEAALTRMVQRCHAPILFAALTTAAGLLGLLSSSLAPIATLGLFGALGTMAGYALALFGAVLVLKAMQPHRLLRADDHQRLACGMAALSVLGLRHRRLVLAATAAVTLLSLLGVRQLDYSHNSLLWLPEDNPARRSTEVVDAAFNGTVNLELLIAPRGSSDFRSEELMRRVDAAAAEAHGLAGVPVGRHTSIIDFLKETNEALHGGDPRHHAVPSQEEIWDELLLLEGEGTDDTQRYVTIDYELGRLSFLTPWLEAKRYTAFIQEVEALFERRLGDLAEVQATGLIALLAVTSTAVLASMTSSYAFALLQITVLMCISLGRVRLGLLSMLPNIAPFILLLGIMGALAIPLDTFTVLIGSIITGLIVDDTTHYFFQYRRHLEEQGSVEAAIRATVQDVGVPMLTTTLVVMAGFSIFAVSQLHNLQAFGLLMALGAFLALWTELLVSPALLASVAHVARREDPAAEPPIPSALPTAEAGHAA